MFRIKRLYSFVLEAFLPLLLATFGVCLFILLMQFLWKYVDDMVGKGIDMIVLAKMFFFAATSLVPMAMPLAVLLASLMTFGNLGEHFELLAMKSAGVSLLRIMRPLIFVLIFICGISFYFQNNIFPVTQVKLYTLILSMKQKSPELDIPEGSFFKNIPGYNMYVRHKDKHGGMMRDLMIYDQTKGFENITVIVADSGRLKMSEDKLHLVLTLYSGVSFENYGSKERRTVDERTRYRREKFTLKEILITFDSNFNMADESIMQGRNQTRNMKELVAFLDSAKVKSDSVSELTKKTFADRVYVTAFHQKEDLQPLPNTGQDTVVIGNWDHYFESKSLSDRQSLVDRAKNRVETFRNDYNYEAFYQTDRLQQIRMSEIEIHRRFSLSLACLLFFFIGGPLGAIIRKGGLGMPAVLSVILFLSYYTIDIFGLKMARQGIWTAWQGMWLSTVVLLALGIFFTYKAVNDSVMMSPDVWKEFFRKFFGKRDVRNYQRREVILTPPNYKKDIERLNDLDFICKKYIEKLQKWPRYDRFWKNGFSDDDLMKIIYKEEEIIDDMRNSTENLIIGKLMDYPILKNNYPDFFNKPLIRLLCSIVFPIGLVIYIIAMIRRNYVLKDIKSIIRINNDLKNEIHKNNFSDIHSGNII